MQKYMNAITYIAETVIKIGIKLPNSCQKKTSGLMTDNELKFEPHNKSNVKTNATSKISKKCSSIK